MAEHGGKAPPKKGGGEKKPGGGFWGFVSDVLSNVDFNINVGRPSNATDPAERMQPVRDERKEAYEETIYRKTEGAEGTAPAERLERGRKTIARSLDNRMGAHAEPKVPQGGGAPLSGDVRARMEPRLGSDLSGVRVHTSGDAAAAAQDLSAKAFTVGSDVHFGSGQYQPGTKEGDRLIAHELTHVVQGQRSGIQRKPSTPVNDDPGLEHEADAAGAKAAHGDHEVSHPDEPAEKEADHVGDHVADDLHGGGGGGGAAAADAAPAGDDKQKKSGEQAGEAKGDKKEGGKDARAGAPAATGAAGASSAHASAAGGAAAGGASSTAPAAAQTPHAPAASSASSVAASAHGGSADAAKGGGAAASAPDVKQQAPAVGTKRLDDAVWRAPITQTYDGRKISRKPTAKASPPPTKASPPATTAATAKSGGPAASAPKEPPKPPKALSVSPVNAEASNAGFADAFAALPPSGKVPGVQGPGGDPAQIAEQIAKRPGGRLDPSGTLTLPPIDTGAVAAASSPQQAATLIAQQTGVPTVNMSPKEDSVDFEVQVNPVTQAASVRPKNPSERAEFKTALGKLDATAKPVIKQLLDERRMRYTRATSWADARTKLEAEPVIKQILDKPFNLGSDFGDAAHAEGIVQLNKALVATGSKPLKEIDAGTKISHWKAQINDEVSPFVGINPALRAQFWDAKAKTKASQAMYTAFEERLKLGEDEEHDWYRPQNRKEVALAGGGMRITYTNSKGADFDVAIGADGMVESITGTHLTLKEPGSSGATGTAGRKVPNQGMESSHLIADRFRGSGYKSSANLIATSAHYNKPLMYDAEEQIVAFMKNMKATELQLTVAVKWTDVDSKAVVTALQKAYPDVVKPKIKEKLQAELDGFVKRMQGESPNLKRVKETKYTVKVKDKNGLETPMDDAPELGMDLWLGMKSAPTGK